MNAWAKIFLLAKFHEIFWWLNGGSSKYVNMSQLLDNEGTWETSVQDSKQRHLIIDNSWLDGNDIDYDWWYQCPRQLKDTSLLLGEYAVPVCLKNKQTNTLPYCRQIMKRTHHQFLYLNRLKVQYNIICVDSTVKPKPYQHHQSILPAKNPISKHYESWLTTYNAWRT